MNPMNMLRMFMGKGMNPQQMVMNMVNKNNPLMGNMVSLAQQGKKDEVERIARNLCSEKGINFDEKFQEFMNTVNKK